MKVCKSPQKLNLAIKNNQILDVMNADDPQSYEEAVKNTDSEK